MNTANVHAGRLERRVRPVARRETVLAFCPGAAWEAEEKNPLDSPAKPGNRDCGGGRGGLGFLETRRG